MFNKILIAVFFVILITSIIAFSYIYPFKTLGYGWQCAISGFVGFLLIVCILIEVRKKDIKTNGK
jgi:hypothetical protein